MYILLFGDETKVDADTVHEELLYKLAKLMASTNTTRQKGAYDLKHRVMTFVEDELKFACAICQLLPRKSLHTELQREDGRFMQETKGTCWREIGEEGFDWPDSTEGMHSLLYSGGTLSITYIGLLESRSTLKISVHAYF